MRIFNFPKYEINPSKCGSPEYDLAVFKKVSWYAICDHLQTNLRNFINLYVQLDLGVNCDEKLWLYTVREVIQLGSVSHNLCASYNSRTNALNFWLND